MRTACAPWRPSSNRAEPRASSPVARASRPARANLSQFLESCLYAQSTVRLGWGHHSPHWGSAPPPQSHRPRSSAHLAPSQQHMRFIRRRKSFLSKPVASRLAAKRMTGFFKKELLSSQPLPSFLFQSPTPARAISQTGRLTDCPELNPSFPANCTQRPAPASLRAGKHQTNPILTITRTYRSIYSF
jgi:hypothetical protein